jgi:aminoglycoside 6'-N-acetyltransferase I
VIRPVEPRDRHAWARMRNALWPGKPEDHVANIERFFVGEAREPLAVMMAFDQHGEATGFIELSIRSYAEGCVTDRVAFIEGWYVDPRARRQGIGAALVRAAETWGREQGCTELGSDAEVENFESANAYRAVGFEETGIVRCFLKSL